MKVMKVKVSNLHKAAKKHFAQQQWVGVDQSVSLVERCRDLIAKQTIFPNTITGSQLAQLATLNIWQEEEDDDDEENEEDEF